jgi:adenine-specific DNA-methyltransferase
VPKKTSTQDTLASKTKKRPIEQYDHKGKKRVNNPPVGLVTPQTDPPTPTHRTYEYDPHLDPQLVWAGKKEHTSFEVPTVSLHVHERIDPRTIIESVRKRNGNGLSAGAGRPVQGYLFETREENPPLREAIDFYRHAHGWSNRLIAGDSLLVMNSLLEKEGMAGQVQMVYIDPPYGIRYGSNFQPFVNRRNVKDGKDEDLTQEPEMVRAFRDTWELRIHSYLTYLRDRLLLAHDLLHEGGSCFVQIGEENLHHVQELMDEVFKAKNFVRLIHYTTAGGFTSAVLSRAGDFLLWYAKDATRLKYRPLFETKPSPTGSSLSKYDQIELSNGQRRPMTPEEKSGKAPVPQGSRIFRFDNLISSGFRQNTTVEYEFEGQKYHPGANNNWKASIPDGMDRLAAAKRIAATSKGKLVYVRYFDDFPAVDLTSMWSEIGGTVQSRSDPKTYVVQTGTSVIERCLLMTTDAGDLVFDPTCGSGTTAVVAEQWGRRWVTCDTSRVATTLAKQRLMGATFDYYKLLHASEGVGSGFQHRKVTHVSLRSIANSEPPGEEILYDQPLIDNSRARISGPFTVEAVPAPNVKSIDDLDTPPQPADVSIARSGPTLRQSDWRDELLKTGIRGKGGQMINFSRVEPLGGTRWLQADAETKGVKPERAVISFGPDYAPLETRQVEMAWEEARTLIPKPDIIVFAAFQFDPEAAKDIDELTKEKTGMTFLTAQMNADLLTNDLKKKRSSNQSFWLVGRPDVDVRRAKPSDVGADGSVVGARFSASKGAPGSGDLYVAEVRGFDYFNTRTGSIESGDTTKIAMWLLDTDYDGRSLYPRQVFFPLADDDEGWAKLARNLKAEIDPERIEAYRGTVSLPFDLGEHKRVAVKVIDDRGIPNPVAPFANGGEGSAFRSLKMSHTYCVYILASRSRNLYTGVTNNLERRMVEHRQGLVPGFTSRYRIFRLVHFELFGDIRYAIAREKEIKAWRREKKIWLIRRHNPTWADLAERLTNEQQIEHQKLEIQRAGAGTAKADPSPPFAKTGRPGSG